MSSRVQPGMSEHKGIADRLKTLETQVARLARARTMQSTSLDGGTFRVKNGGTIEILDASGNVIFTFDVAGMTGFEPDGSTLMELDGAGIVLNDGSANKLLDLTTTGLKAYTSSGTLTAHLEGGRLRLWDSSGNIVFDSNFAFSAWVMSDTDAQASSSSTTWVTVATFHGPMEQPARAMIPIDAATNNLDTSGDVRIRQDDGVQTVIDGPATVIGGLDEFTLVRHPTFVSHATIDTWPAAEVQIRRSSGTGTVFARCRRPAGWA